MKKAEERVEGIKSQNVREASESSPPSQNSTTEETGTAEHDAIQAAAIAEPQDQDYEYCECFGTFED